MQDRISVPSLRLNLFWLHMKDDPQARACGFFYYLSLSYAYNE